MDIQTYDEAMNWLLFSIVLNIILLFCMFVPNIVFLLHKKYFIWKDVTERGYHTPKQYRYSKGKTVLLLDSDVEYVIVETGRYDYLIRRLVYDDVYGLEQRIVLQSEIRLK
ncbi:hypothetical protein [Leptolyngbya phage Lbo-JY46]